MKGAVQERNRSLHARFGHEIRHDLPRGAFVRVRESKEMRDRTTARCARTHSSGPMRRGKEYPELYERFQKWTVTRRCLVRSRRGVGPLKQGDADGTAFQSDGNESRIGRLSVQKTNAHSERKADQIETQ